MRSTRESFELDSNGFPVIRAEPSGEGPDEQRFSAEQNEPSAPAQSDLVTLAEAAELLGLSPEQAIRELTLASTPRVVGYPRAEIEKLRNVVLDQS